MYMHISKNALFSMVYKEGRMYFSNYSIKKSINNEMGDLIVDLMVNEAMRSIDYYDRHFLASPVQKIKVAGSELLNEDMLRQAHNDIDMPIEEISLSELTDTFDVLNSNTGYLISTGVALR